MRMFIRDDYSKLGVSGKNEFDHTPEILSFL